jgi:putative membrane protein
VLGFIISADIFFDLSFALLFFALAQSIFELGTKNALFFLVLSAVIGYAAEVLGTSTGFPFGQYSYSELLGPKVLGVPVFVPLIWFVISYVTLSVTQDTVISEGEIRRQEQQYPSNRFSAILSL